MSIFDRGIRGNVQSPFASVDANTIAYGNARMPIASQGSVKQGIDYALEALYPNYKGTAATPAALPATGNTANDWWLVTDDGDGKSAGYVWTVSGSSASWVKRYDVDWSYESILAETVNRTQYMYVAKYGMTDKDGSGNPITGMFGGQTIYGGDATNENLTLTPNFYDASGYVQSTSHFRPTTVGTLDIGTVANPWRTIVLATSAKIGTTTYGVASIADSGTAFSFNALNVTTTGVFTAAAFDAGTLALAAGSITDTSGAISFGATALTTTGTITGAQSSKLADITFTNGTLSTSSAAFNFSNKDVSGVGTLTASKVVTNEVDVGNLVLSGQTLTTSSSATALVLQQYGGGNSTTVQIGSKAVFGFDVAITGALGVTGNTALTGTLAVGSVLNLATSTGKGLISTSAGNITFQPFTGIVAFAAALNPDADATRDVGASALRFRNIYASGSLGDGTNTVSMATLLSLRNINTGAATGNVLEYNTGTGLWTPVAPSGTIDHTALLNLTAGDAGHTQFAMLGGRAGGQTIYGDTAASGSLVLASTTNAAKGFVLLASDLGPQTDAAYSAGWTGTNLGSSSRNFNNIYSKGVHYGLRLEQYAGSGAYPASSGQNVGRTIFDTVTNQVVIDTGAAWVPAGQQKFLQDLTWTGAQTTQTIVTSGSISDARTGMWQLLDNTNSFATIYCTITKTQTSVTITVSPALPAGSYRLIGLN